MPKIVQTDPETTDFLQRMAKQLDVTLNETMRLRAKINGTPEDVKWGFVFAMFPMDEENAVFNWVSNADRSQIAGILRALADQLSRERAKH